MGKAYCTSLQWSIRTLLTVFCWKFVNKTSLIEMVDRFIRWYQLYWITSIENVEQIYQCYCSAIVVSITHMLVWLLLLLLLHYYCHYSNCSLPCTSANTSFRKTPKLFSRYVNSVFNMIAVWHQDIRFYHALTCIEKCQLLLLQTSSEIYKILMRI